MITYFNNFLPLESDREVQMDKQLNAFFHDKRGGYIKYANAYILPNDDICMEQFTADTQDEVCFFTPMEMFSELTKHCYVSLATFQKKDGARRDFNVFNRSIMYVDLDIHAAVDCEAVLNQTALILTDAYNNNQLPIPTMINHTGRGLGIFYILEHSINESVPELKKTRLAFDGIYKRLVKKYQSLLDAAGITDVHADFAVLDKTRLVRVAGTVNPNNGKVCNTIFRNEDGYGHMTYVSSLDDIGRYVPVEKYTPPKKRKKKHVSRNMDEILKDRADMLRRLILLRKEDTGSRHMMLFIAYQTLRQLQEKEDAVSALSEMNRLYQIPLPQRELDGIIRSTERNKPYTYTNKKIIEVLGITDEECKETGFGISSARKLERAKKKEENKKKRQVRNDAILTMVATGLYTYAQIAEKFDVSVPLIKKLVHDKKKADDTSSKTVYPRRKDIISCYMNNKKRRIKRAFSFWKQGIIFCHLYICAMWCSLPASLGDMREYVGALQYACFNVSAPVLHGRFDLLIPS